MTKKKELINIIDQLIKNDEDLQKEQKTYLDKKKELTEKITEIENWCKNFKEKLSKKLDQQRKPNK